METSAQHAAALQERFYELDNPSIATIQERAISEIYCLAKLHVAIINDLCPLYLKNPQDIHHVINASGDSILQGFLNAHTSEPNKTPLIHYNIGQGQNKILLTKTGNYDTVIEYLGTIHLYMPTSIPSFTPLFS